MASITRTANNIGDVIEITSSSPLVGLVMLSGFTDEISGEAPQRFFNKQFKYSTDGVNFTEWMPLNTGNIQSISVMPTDMFVIQYQYQRSGTSSDGALELESVNVQGTFAPPPPEPQYDASVFKQYFNSLDTEVLNWALNVLEKLYKPGIVPKYIDRTNDFVEYWRPVTLFFGYLVRLSREFERFSSNIDLLRRFLQERDLHFSGSETLNQLQRLAANFYREMMRRGTANIAIERTGQINGELLRLIDKKPQDYFQLVYLKPEHATWNINHSSPLSKSTENMAEYDISYEPGNSFQNIDNYPIFDPDNKITVRTPALVFTNLDSAVSIGISDAVIENNNRQSMSISVNSSLNYLISFVLSTNHPADTGLTLSVTGFDKDFNQQQFINMRDGSSDSTALNISFLNKKIQTIKLVIFKARTSQQANSFLNIGVGNNLIFNTDIVRIVPNIRLRMAGSAGTSVNAKIDNLRIQPFESPQIHNGINVRHHTDFFMKNNSPDKTDKEIESIMREDLIPANTRFQNLYL